jgi:hypothetical protein
MTPSMEAIEHLMDELLPDETVQIDISTILWPDGKDANIEIDDDKWITIPFGCQLEISTKALFKEYHQIAFGRFKVQVAIGGVVSQDYGFLEPKYCWITLYYNEPPHVLSYDFHTEWR